MATPSFPGVFASEIDLSTHIALGDNTTFGAIAGNYEWGPAEEITLITSENVLIDTFGRPNADTYIDWFTSSNFLLYSSGLKTVRVIDNIAKNAVSGNTAVLVKNTTHYEHTAVLGDSGAFIARFPGSKGNSLFVAAADSTAVFTSNVHPTEAFGTWEDFFQTEPGTSNYAGSKGGSLDELHIIVIDEDGLFSGTPGTVLEKYSYLSKAVDAKKDDSTNNYYVDVINSISRYIRIGDGFILNSDGVLTSSATFVAGGTEELSLIGGTDVATSNTAMYVNGYDLFSDKKTVDISHIITAAAPAAAIKDAITTAETRGDCVVYVSPEWTDVQPGQTQSMIADNIVSYKNTTIAANSSYCFFDSNWKYQYDKYNDVYRWVPCNGDIAGLSAKTDFTNEPWFSHAGYNRGILLNAAKLAWNPKEDYMGVIYKAGVNPVIFEEGTGALLFGDKTSLTKPSAFDRINVRKLFNVLKRKVSNAAKFSLFEINDEFTRDQLKSMVDAYLTEVKARRGITDFLVQCDATNNTAEVIDSNTLVCDIYVKPARSVNWIQLNFIAARTGTSFNELIGKI